MPYLYIPLLHQNVLLVLRDCSFPGVLIRAWLIDIRWPHVECKKTKQNKNKNTKFYLTITSLNGSEKIIIILTTSNNLQEPQHIKEEKKNRTPYYSRLNISCSETINWNLKTTSRFEKDMDRNVYRFSSLFLKYDDWKNLKRICEKEFCIDNRDFYPD